MREATSHNSEFSFFRPRTKLRRLPKRCRPPNTGCFHLSYESLMLISTVKRYLPLSIKLAAILFCQIYLIHVRIMCRYQRNFDTPSRSTLMSRKRLVLM